MSLPRRPQPSPRMSPITCSTAVSGSFRCLTSRRLCCVETAVLPSNILIAIVNPVWEKQENHRTNASSCETQLRRHEEMTMPFDMLLHLPGKAFSASRSSYVFWRFIQKTTVVLKKAARRTAVSPVMPRCPLIIAVIRFVGTSRPWPACLH